MGKEEKKKREGKKEKNEREGMRNEVQKRETNGKRKGWQDIISVTR